MIESEREVRSLLGDPRDVARELGEFQRGARKLSSSRPRLIDRYSKQWVAVYRGKVRAHAKTFRSLMAHLEKGGIPPEHTIVRYIDKNQRTMIL